MGGMGGGRRTPGFHGWWRGSFHSHGVRMANRTGGAKGEPCFGLGCACLWFFLTDGTRLFEISGKYKLCPPLKFRTYCGSGVGW